MAAILYGFCSHFCYINSSIVLLKSIMLFLINRGTVFNNGYPFLLKTYMANMCSLVNVFLTVKFARKQCRFIPFHKR